VNLAMRPSQTLYAPLGRAERLIAAGRVVLAASSLLAVWLDPSEPAKHAQIAYLLLVSYLVYSVAIAVLVGQWESSRRALRLPTHAFDLLLFSLIVYFTAGPSSPFIAYYVFSLVCGTLRWGWRGALWTAVVALGAFLGVGYYFGEVLRDPDFLLHRFIIRGVYLAVVAVLLGYLGAHEEQARREMSQLAAWPQGGSGASPGLERLLSHAGAVLAAPRVALAWAEREEPWLHLALWSPDGLELDREAPSALQPLVAEALTEESFLCADLQTARPVVLRQGEEGVQRWAGQPLHPELPTRWRPRSVLAVPVVGETVDGRLFFFDKVGLDSDDLLLGEIVGGLLAASLDHANLVEQVQESAAIEERIRLARDLHDGVLQSLTGIALRLAAARGVLPPQVEEVRDHLEELQRVIALEQRDLRFFIQELRPPVTGLPSESMPLGARLSELLERFEREWGLRVELEMGSLDHEVSPALAREIYHIVREAVVNSVRHGEASRVTVALAEEGGRLALRIADNGRGFTFQGRYTGELLGEMDLGPRNLRERVTALAGALELESSPEGARLDIELPVA
jgi:signal transduction histidine kinase